MGGEVTEVLLYCHDCIYLIIGSFSVFSYIRECQFHSSTWSTQTWDYFDLFIEKCLQKCYIFTLKIDIGRLVNLCTKENKTLFTFLTTENLSGLPCSHECKSGAYSDLSSYAEKIMRVNAFTP